jgi:hypothetical protein
MRHGETMKSDTENTINPNPQTLPLSRHGDGNEIHFLELVRVYARENPDVVAICCFSLGFVLGWKLKPW